MRNQSILRKYYIISAVCFIAISVCVICILILNRKETEAKIVYNTPSAKIIQDNRDMYKKHPSKIKSSNSQSDLVQKDISNSDDINPHKVINPPVNTSDNQSTSETVVTATNTAVSPHGFGSYPELPDRWPSDYWDREMSREHELIGRVRIKLYNEGKWTEGITIDHGTGLVYPIYRDTVYIRWGTFTDINGDTQRYIRSSKGHPDTIRNLEQIGIINEFSSEGSTIFNRMAVSESDLPSDIKFLTYSEGGIDPMQYLGFDK